MIANAATVATIATVYEQIPVGEVCELALGENFPGEFDIEMEMQKPVKEQVWIIHRSYPDYEERMQIIRRTFETWLREDIGYGVI